MAIDPRIANPMIADIAGNAFAPIRKRQELNALAERSAAPSNALGQQRNALADYEKQVPQGDIGERLIADLQRDLGLSRPQAAGVVGNLAHESGVFESLQEISPIVKGSRGGYGYAQWTGPRRRAFEKWASERGLDPSSYEANYGFLKHELTETPEGRVLPAIRGVSSADDAARLFSDRFLRPGIPHMNSRIALARKYAG